MKTDKKYHNANDKIDRRIQLLVRKCDFVDVNDNTRLTRPVRIEVWGHIKSILADYRHTLSGDKTYTR